MGLTWGSWQRVLRYMVDCVRRMVNEGMEVSLVNEPQLFVRKLQKEVPPAKRTNAHTARTRARTHTQHARTRARTHTPTHPRIRSFTH